MKILDRYLIKETFVPFLLGIVGFVLVMIVDLLFTFVDLIINKGIDFSSVLQLMLYKLPYIMVMTFPVATLFGVSMAMGRMGKDNEITALRTSGISFKRIARPIIILSILVSALAFLINEKLVPYANQQSQTIIREIVMKQPLPEIKEDVFFKDAYNRYFYVKKINNKDKILENIMVYELTGEDIPRITTAQKSKIEGLKIILYNGSIHNFDKSGRLAYEAIFKEIELNLNEDPFAVSNYKTSEQMDSTELVDKINTLEKSGVSTQALKTDYLMKFSIPLASFVFAIIGIPLSLPTLKSNRAWGMIVTIIIMFTFYVFASVFRSFGRGGIVSPLFAAWTPQFLFGILGAALLFREANK
ncbi:hypothetical protein A3J90_00310 [candidate division WOR-1 bacterium RIFOXYC2_FULL_37_10]|uniref:LPS export ABC transporter permease LptG n=1 Tax=candidate division WOR-1 bacterium RIFOXYB2_FULL_37_13 TaxID=1802579 RepID=A0A1F4SPU5_UNCSA|nr:MAG: hypothetical protein A2246_03045 [candidate division WOR-1 bacterium RIFOXYA2_FULL_37_7]OGC21713.1 MAG: hypothetical protein A2310_00195 [candidate division WOR-1 bacterium RIFOXYB2_FULL_37_13]OGC32576.1 MAG: hypothetical protein A3J90_00310 [candidate division WOR-1 bacterium RIFOXYC2_FULL_37_10]